MSSLDVSNINSRYCVYNCNTKIYWNAVNSEYLEVNTMKKHFCPNRPMNGYKPLDTAIKNISSSKFTPYRKEQTNNHHSKNNHNYKKSWHNSNFNQSMDNSMEILHGSANTIIRQYEVLSDLIKEFKGKTHGSQSHSLQNNCLQIVVYYEVPEGMRDKLKGMFNAYTQNESINNSNAIY